MKISFGNFVVVDKTWISLIMGHWAGLGLGWAWAGLESTGPLQCAASSPCPAPVKTVSS